MSAYAGGPKLPWEGKAQPADKVIVAVIMLSGIYGLATMPLIPWMIQEHPVWLAAIRGGMTSIVNLGAMARIGEVNVLVAIFVGLPATVMFDWAYWWAGARWGERALHMILGESRKTEARLEKVKRWTEKYGALAVLTAYYLPVPTVLIYAAAGWAGMRLTTFLILDIVGALLWVGVLAGLGYWAGQSAVDAVDAVADYTLYITIAIVVVVVARQVWTTRRQIKEATQAAHAEKAARDSAAREDAASDPVA
ncbi:DedA family protein [Sporichthya sp.]|uniref:DedA family protein n=1 Tax=Sporichthya sp. TaxID=65475 RepID=UPI0017ED7FD7|nr:DedA family protein [Sporichthya sp.]MBA3741708.1 DedA family protein [Sporichthya sp.]